MYYLLKLSQGQPINPPSWTYEELQKLKAWRILNFAWLKPKKLQKFLRAQGFKGNSYKPLHGDLPQLGKMLKEASSKPISLSNDIATRVIPFFIETIKKYGDNSLVWFGPKPSILITDNELTKEIMLKPNIFQKPPSNPLTRLLAQGLVAYEGDKWTKHRKIINPAFHVEKLKNMLPAFHLSVSEMLSKWEDKVSREGTCELDVWPYLQTLTSDAISRTSFGSSFEEGRKIFELQIEQADLVMKVQRTLYFPGRRYLPTKRNRRMKYITNVVEESIRNIIEKRMKAMKEGEGEANKDLLGMLLESNVKEIKEHGDKSFGMSINDVIEECKLFYFAGEETTSVLLSWTLVLLSIHQDWQSRARAEVLQFFGNKEPDFEGLNHLKIVTMILNETLRLYPPVVILSRQVSQDTKLGNLSLPEGLIVTLPIILLHHDSKIWGEDAKEFNPNRFKDGVSNATKGQVAFFPFGWGPRICIGQNFAMVEAKLAMAMILQRFSFHLSPSYAHAPHTIITLQPQHGAPLIFHKL